MSRRAVRVCPRCRCPFSYIKEKRVNGRVYLYAVHYYRDSTGRRRVKECYLGPKDHYKYVTKMHEKEELVLKGLVEQERIVEYFDSIIRYVINDNVDENIRMRILERIEETRYIVRRSV